MSKPLTYRRAAPSDWPGIEALLRAADLPLDGAREHLSHFVVGEADGLVQSVAGLERYGQVALLRSVAVAHGLRGQGIGEQLLGAIRDRAREEGVAALYLLTTTAAAFFGKRGFQAVDRQTAPAVLHASREFQGACPASATFMVAALTA